MSRDIRSYFLPGRGEKKKDEKNKDSKQNSGAKPRKRQFVILDSDSDEDTLPTKVKKVEERIKNSSLSDKKDKHSRSDTEKKSIKESSKLKPVNVADIFGTSQVKRTVTKPKEKEEISSDVKLMLEDQHSDSDFEATLRQLDEQQLGFKKEKKRTPVNEKEKIPVKEKPKLKAESTESNKNIDEPSKISPTRNNRIVQKPDKGEVAFLHEKIENKEKESGNHRHSTKTSSDLFKKDEERKSGVIRHENKHSHERDSKATSPAVVKTSLDDSLSDDPFEKKRQHAIQYQKYLQREGPKNLGGKEIPEGKPGCLSGLVFVITGVLETIDREQTSSLIQQYGGRVTSSISRNTSYLIVGDEPGSSKMEKAMKLNTKQLTEDGFLDLIRTSPGLPDGSKIPINSSKKKYVKKDDNEIRSSKPLLNDDEHEHLVEVSKTIKKEETAAPEIKREVQTNSLPQPPPPKGSSVETVGSSSQQHVKTFSLWADKYKPNSVKQIIGQQGDRSNVKKLLKWLHNWHSNHSGKKKLVRPSPWAKDDNGAFFKAALLSGPPGVGKTTTAHLVCKELGFDVVEFNASDTRSKKLLHQEVTELLSSKSLSGYFQGATGSKPTENHVLVMDEVDGMAGNEDRGGVQELIQLIKSSHVPIICMCNDRHHQKIRSLTNYCFDLPFSKPRLEQIRGAMMSICFKEGIKISPEALNDVITGANQDVRQVLHHLSMWSVKDKQLSVEQAKDESQKAKKNIKLGPWDVLKKVFSADAHKTMSIHDKSDLFFHDYSLGPLFVQENYLGVMPHKARGNKNKHLELVARTADSLSSGDLVEKSIRSRNAWSLLPMQAMFSSVLPGYLMEGHLMSQINFPAWLGKNSRRNKFQRLLQELHMHMRLSISGSKEAVNLDYLMYIRDSIINPLIKEGAEGIPATLAIMQNYYLMREDIDSIMELSLWPHQKDPMSMVESKVKAALTRTYNKGGILTPYSIINVKKGAAKTNPDMEMEIEGEDLVDEEEEEEDITNDAMIKAKKRPAPTRDSASGSNSVKRGKCEGKSTKKDGKALKKDGKGKKKM